MVKIKKIKGQSTVEYIVLVAAVTAVWIVFLSNSNSTFQKTMNDAYTKTSGGMNTMADKLTQSWTTP